MKACLLIAGVVLLLNCSLAAGAWTLLAKQVPRPWLARAGGALIGAAIGGWVSGPELGYVAARVCEQLRSEVLCNASFLVPVFYLYPFILPATVALSAWLLAEIIGGRGARPLFALGPMPIT